MNPNETEYIDKEEKTIFPINPEFDAKIDKDPENWNDILLSWLTPKLKQKLFSIIDKFEYKNFITGVQYEYGVDGVEKDLNKAYEIYKQNADTSTDTLSMYKMYMIHFKEYAKFGIQRDRNLEKFYLFKCFAFSNGSIINHDFALGNKVDLLTEVAQHLALEDPNLSKFVELINHLENNNKYKIPTTDLQLIKSVLCFKFPNKDLSFNSILLFSKLNLSKNTEAIYKMGVLFMDIYINQASVCFSLCEKNKYYRAYADYGLFLFNKANNPQKGFEIFKEGYKHGCQQCAFLYFDAYMNENYSNILKENPQSEKDIIELLNILIEDIICGNIFSIFEFLFFRKICIKHFGLKKVIEKNFNEYAYEICDMVKNLVSNTTLIKRAFHSSFGLSEILLDYGCILFMGIDEHIKRNREESLQYFYSSYKNSNTKSFKRFCYSYIVRIREMLYKENKLSKEKYIKTCKKVYQFFNSSIDEGKIDEFSASFFYYLARLEEKGIGTKPNIVKAYTYYSKASKKKIIFLGSGSIIAHYRRVKSANKLLNKDINHAIDIINNISIENDNEGYGNDGSICCICYENKRDTIIVPCLHIICETCLKKLPDREVCPICRGKIFLTKKNNIK